MKGEPFEMCDWWYSEDDHCEAVCPHCKGTWQDLWDYEWGNQEIIEVDCPHCGKEIMLSQNVTVTYSTKAKEAKDGL